MPDSDQVGPVTHFHADKSLVFSYIVLFLIASSLGKAVFDGKAPTLGQGQLTQNKQIAKLPLWSGASTSNRGKRRRQKGQELSLSSITIFSLLF